MKLIQPGPYQTKRKKAAHHLEKALCWATHPEYINDSTNARGRVLHMERHDEKFNYPATYCGMRVMELACELDAQYRRICIQCEKIFKQEQTATE